MVTILKRMRTVAKTKPHFSNASGMDRMPPPTIVATRANVADTRVAWRVVVHMIVVWLGLRPRGHGILWDEQCCFDLLIGERTLWL